MLVAGCEAPPAPHPVVNVGPRSTLSDDEATIARRACRYRAGELPGITLAKTDPVGTEIPIDTIVVLMFENRSFDHIFGDLGATQPEADVAPADAMNLDSGGHPIRRFHDTEYCFGDTNHEWSGSHGQWNGGKMDGFVRTNEGFMGATDGVRAMSCYTAADLPTFHFAADTFAVADRYFCSLLGPTFPNREYLYAATSFGTTNGQLFKDYHPTLLDALSDSNVPWRVYYEVIPGPGMFLETLSRTLPDHFDKLPYFFEAAAAGTLDNVVFVDPDLKNEWGGGNDMHPPGDVQNGDAFLTRVIEALIRSPQWPRIALFVTFDEHGGLYDHVPPPPACPPDDLLPIVSDPLGPFDAKFDRYGFRVPAIVISPWAKPHFVSHRIYDHTSIARFIEARFRLAALTARDANADPMLDMFDFSRPALMVPPLPAINVDAVKLQACRVKYPKE